MLLFQKDAKEKNEDGQTSLSLEAQYQKHIERGLTAHESSGRVVALWEIIEQGNITVDPDDEYYTFDLDYTLRRIAEIDAARGDTARREEEADQTDEKADQTDEEVATGDTAGREEDADQTDEEADETVEEATTGDTASKADVVDQTDEEADETVKEASTGDTAGRT